SGLNPPLAPPDPRPFASVCVERPNRRLVRTLVGLLKFGWLKILKNSARKRSLTFSVKRNCRCNAISACQAPKPRRTLRPKFPCCPAGAALKAARLKILPPGYCVPCNSRGTPGLTFGRESSLTPAAEKDAPITSTGGADLAKTKASSDQLP